MNLTESPKPFTVALTGGIASGKSTVSEKFAALGVPIVDTDIIAKQIVGPGGAALEKIRETFSDEVLNPDGTLDRAKMRRLIFNDHNAKARLEDILHPEIISNVIAQVSVITDSYCILVVPLLVESENYDWVDRVLVVDVPESVQLERLMKRDGISVQQAQAILDVQASREKRLLIADDLIENTGSISNLDRAVEELHQKFSLLAKSA